VRLLHKAGVLLTTAGNSYGFCKILILTTSRTAPASLRRKRRVQQGWLRIPGKHRNRDAAWDVVEGMLSTKH
jgi:hypothetical protein